MSDTFLEVFSSRIFISYKSTDFYNEGELHSESDIQELKQYLVNTLQSCISSGMASRNTVYLYSKILNVCKDIVPNIQTVFTPSCYDKSFELALNYILNVEQNEDVYDSIIETVHFYRSYIFTHKPPGSNKIIDVDYTNCHTPIVDK